MRPFRNLIVLVEERFITHFDNKNIQAYNVIFLTISSGGSRISHTKGTKPLRRGKKPNIWEDFCQKLHENEKKIDRAHPCPLPRTAKDFLPHTIYRVLYYKILMIFLPVNAF